MNYTGQNKANNAKNKEVHIKYKGKKNQGYMDSSADILKK